MSKGKAQVSTDFNKFYQKNTVAIEEAKKAENSMSSGPCEVGWEGRCVLLEATAEVGKPKKDEKGNVKEGNPRVRMKFSIVEDNVYQGKTFTKMWIFNSTANATALDRFEWFLNACEAMGLPREVRTNHTDPSEVLNWLLDSELVFNVKCESDDYAQDKKKMTVTAPAEAVDSSDSMVPGGEMYNTPSASSAPAASSTPSSTPSTSTSTSASADWPKEGDKVKFLMREWTVASREGEDLILTRQEGDEVREREAKVSGVKPL
jgi:hypothetical protein